MLYVYREKSADDRSCLDWHISTWIIKSFIATSSLQTSSSLTPAPWNYATLASQVNSSTPLPIPLSAQAHTCPPNVSKGHDTPSKATYGVSESLSSNSEADNSHGEGTTHKRNVLVSSTGGVLELLQQIVNEPPPKLPEGKDYQGLDILIERCLVKDPDKRPRPEELMVPNPFEKG